jgi:hypothetical protein
MEKDAKAAEAEREADATASGFEGLYEDEFSRRQREKASRNGQGGGRAA